MICFTKGETLSMISFNNPDIQTEIFNYEELEQLSKEMLILKIKNLLSLNQSLINKNYELMKRCKDLENMIVYLGKALTNGQVTGSPEEVVKILLDKSAKEKKRIIEKIEQLNQEKQTLENELKLLQNKLLEFVNTSKDYTNDNEEREKKYSEESQINNNITLTENEKNVMYVIGKYGVAEVQDIEKLLKQQGYKTNMPAIANAIKNLLKADILINYNVSTGKRSFYVYKMSEFGKGLYKVLYQEEPAESEIDMMIKQHDSIEHGYTIKEVVKILTDKWECPDVSMDRDKNTIKLPNGHSYIPDIIATTREGKKLYIEVELGNTYQDEFNMKLKKMLNITNSIIIITTSEEVVKSKLENQVKAFLKFIGKNSEYKGATIKITTTNLLERQKYLRQFDL